MTGNKDSHSHMYIYMKLYHTIEHVSPTGGSCSKLYIQYFLNGKNMVVFMTHNMAQIDFPIGKGL